VITRGQAREAGMSESGIDRRVRSERWEQVFPGVYRIVGAPVSARHRAMAAALWADGPVSHLGAGRLPRLDALPKPDAIDVTISRRSSLSVSGLIVHRSALARSDQVRVDGIPCTSATRTLVDCAGLVDGEVLETAFEQARRMGLTSVRALERRLTRGRRGSAVLREVLAHAQAKPKESRLEVKLARLLGTSSLPKPIAQFEIASFRVDYAWPPSRAICECDGFAWHGNRMQWKRDRKRIAAIEAAGWRIVHITWDDVTRRPEQTLARVELALAGVAA
jgi:very-short-patch-repair endonuclease